MVQANLWSTLIVGLLAQEALCWKPVVEPKEKLTTTQAPKPWLRTIYSTKKEIVTPTIIAGVTFSAKPVDPSNPLKPWVSLKKDGVPVTIKPEINKGITKKGAPDYKTYFQQVSTRTFSYEELKAHNMKPDEVHEEEFFIPEDDTYLSLNPIIRCIPERYFEKGAAKNDLSEPFCTPHEGVDWRVGNTYFASWYTKFFKDATTGKTAEKVRLHITHVDLEAKERGYHNKRDTNLDIVYSSEWIDNDSGMLPIEIQHGWLGSDFERKVIISVQPDYLTDEEFDFVNGVIVYLSESSKVFKPSKDQIALEQANLHGKKWYIIVLAIPSCVTVALICMYIFLYINKGHRDFSKITKKALNKKRRVLGNFAEMKRFQNMKNHKYDELPRTQRKFD